jgi:hypothetical protein
MNIFGITLSNADIYLLAIAGGLTVIVISAIIFRKNAFFIKRREQKDELINNLLSPFTDAVVNIEHGERNYIFIMNALYQGQKESISRAKAIARRRDKAKIETAWNDYECFYQKGGKTRDVDQFMTFPPDFEKSQKAVLCQHIDAIVKSIKGI